MKIFKTFRFICVTVLFMIGTEISAYDFTVDGIYYEIESLSDLTCGVTSVGDEKYAGNIIIPDKVTYKNKKFTVTLICTLAFYRCSRLTSITIPNSVTKVGSSAFEGCSGLKKVTIEDGIKTLLLSDYNCETKGCFSDCPLTSLYLGRNVSYSECAPFLSISTLTEVTIGNYVTEIGNNNKYYGFFHGCSGLTNLYSLNHIPPRINFFSNKQYMELNVYVPQGSLSLYQADDVWKNFWNLQEFDPTGVGTIKANGKKTKDTYYDIQGLKLDAPKNGLNIINGKKVLIRK